MPTLLVAVLLALLALPAQALANPARPNIVVVLVDDMGWDDPGFMGNAYHETPAMDRLAARGVVFSNAYAAAPNCKPSRASLLTGLYPPHHGIYSVFNPNEGSANERRVTAPPTRTRLAAGIPTLASTLAAAGYATALIGKWDLGDGDSAPAALGFQSSLGSFRGGMLPDGFFAPYGLPGLENAPPGEYLTDRLGREAVRFIEAHAGQPFFLLLSHYAVHLPLEAPQATREHFRAKPQPAAGYNASYAAMLAHADASLAAVLDSLERLQLGDNTVLVLASDNGSYLERADARFSGGKGSLQEGGIRTPLVIAWPGQLAPRQESTPVHGVDIMPTLLAAAGVAVPPLDGSNLWPCLQQSGCEHERSLFWHFPVYLADASAPDGYFRARPQAAMRRGDWKLLQDLESGRVQLFNLAADPNETTDLATAQAGLRDALLSELQQWQATTAAALPAPNPDWQQLSGWRLAWQRAWYALEGLRIRWLLRIKYWQAN